MVELAWWATVNDSKRTSPSTFGHGTYAERGQNVCMVPYADTKPGRAIFNGSIPMKLHGQCHCGAIAYEAEVEVGTMNVCHCLDCQTLTGSAFRTNNSGASARLSPPQRKSSPLHQDRRQWRQTSACVLRDLRRDRLFMRSGESEGLFPARGGFERARVAWPSDPANGFRVKANCERHSSNDGVG